MCFILSSFWCLDIYRFFPIIKAGKKGRKEETWIRKTDKEESKDASLLNYET